MSRPFLLRRRPRAGALAATLFLALGAPLAHADTVVTSTQGEDFSSTLQSVSPLFDSTAYGGKSLGIRVNAAVQRTVQLPTSTTSISVRVRGTQCNGAPNLQLVVDGISVLSTAVSSTVYTTMTVAKALAAGSHTVSVAFANDYYLMGTCDRNLYVDKVDFSTATTTSTATARPRLRWAPPALSSPTTIAVAQGDVSYSLDTTKDYILKLPTTTHLGGVFVNGGRNVVIVGGAIGLPPTSLRSTALTLKNNTGTVHVEGVWFDGTLGHEMDAIQISSPAAVVQVQNVRATGLVGSFDTNHTDVIQPWGGVGALRVDRLSADSSYQGLFTRPDQGPIGSITAQNVDLTYDDPGTATGGYMVWMTTGCDMAPTNFSNVYVNPGPNRKLGNSVWPAVSDSMCPATVSEGTVTWPNLPVTGSVTGGIPLSGAFVPHGAAGTAYTSPGYL